MKIIRKFIILLPLLLITFTCACSTNVNYWDYVSENRNNIYSYESDELTLKIYCVEKETPYLLDGIKGNVNPIVEIYATFSTVPDNVSVSVKNYSGDMNYHSVGQYYYVSFTASDFDESSLPVNLTFSGKTQTINAACVKYDGVITSQKALDCAIAYDEKTFNNLTENNLFKGEIHVRLLYDEKCFYYVGVCDASGNVIAYLIDGENGTVIATKNVKPQN